MKADLHMHTTNSDGTCTPLEVCDMAKRRGMNVIAITDHDTFTDTTDISIADLCIIYGVEVSAVCNGENIHVLAYFKNYPDKEFLDYLDDVKRRRVERANKICDLLEEHFSVKLNRDFTKKGNSVTRGEIYREMVRQGYHYSNTYVFSVMIGNGCPCFIPTVEVEVKSIVCMIKRCHGLAVLAHPMLYKKENLQEIIDDGFDGLEAKYPKFESSFSKYFHMAKKRNMFITAGSDFHTMQELGDVNAKHGEIGQMNLCGHDLDVFLDALDARSK